MTEIGMNILYDKGPKLTVWLPETQELWHYLFTVDSPINNKYRYLKEILYLLFWKS